MNIFLTGASGYIGGTIADALLRVGHQVSGLVRSEQRAAELRAKGMQPVFGNLADADVLTTHARAADAVVHAANADDRASVEALLAALRGSAKVFIQTSGSSTVADDADGAASSAVYEDDTPVNPLPARVPRVALNRLVLDANHEGVRASVIAPTMIYGTGRGLNPNSIQVPKMIALARRRGVAKVIGAGENIWSNVHVEDLADLYLRVLNAPGPGAFYYAENGENSFREIAAAVARMLGQPGEVESMTMAEAIEAYGEGSARYSMGSNSRVRAVRARRELAWAPHRASLLDEIEHGCYAADNNARPAAGA